MSFSSSKSINNIAENFYNGLNLSKNSNDDNYALASGLAADMEIADFNNAWSAKQASINRDFERSMSDTAHQREVADLRAAGLNPILSANSGASTPSGSVGSTDVGVTGSSSNSTLRLLDQLVSQANAATQANAQIMSSQISANAMAYSAKLAYDASIYGTDNPNNLYSFIGDAINGFLNPGDGSHSAGSRAGKTVSNFLNSTAASSAKYVLDKFNSAFGYTGGASAGYTKSFVALSNIGKLVKPLDSNAFFAVSNFLKREGISLNFRRVKSGAYSGRYNVAFNSFGSYNDYLMFCNLVGIRALKSDYFYKARKNNYYIFKQ